MPLTDNEAGDVYRYLAGLLIDNDLDWVVDDVEVTIALGKVATRRLPADETPRPKQRPRYEATDRPDLFVFDADSETTKRRSLKGTPATFTVSEEFTPRERLELLIDSIILTIPNLNAVAKDVADFYSEKIPNSEAEATDTASRVVFAPEGEMSRGFTLDSREIVPHQEAARQLEVLLSELRKEL